MSFHLRCRGVSHFLVSAILGYEFGIGVRSGCFCAHPYILHLLGLSAQASDTVRQHMLAGDRSDMPGLIRLSFGLYNTREDVDILVEALRCISAENTAASIHKTRRQANISPGIGSRIMPAILLSEVFER